MAITPDWLSAQHQCRGVFPVRLASLPLLLDARGACYFPQQDWLVVSDLHLEKGSFLHSVGNPISQMDTYATLIRLSSLIDDYAPATVVCLGDSFHDSRSFSRISEDDRQLLSRLQQNVKDWVWIQGNHDPDIPETMGGRAVKTLMADSVQLAHEYDPGADYQLIGHYHPKCQRTVRRHRFRGRCFLMTESLMIMPAFGQYTGGLDIDHEVLLALAPKRRRRHYLLYDNCIYPPVK
ncbi:ligase-associated DNA damage response endonuclease PdeM [Alteromonas sp. H39]|uniref:ligase-associated DNA damage response endonuclease PdeM n=1 Tax=Alteromonas sp. H39 TaxID=3389876 RepID=UPI0039E1122B